MPRRQFITTAVKTFGVVLGSGMIGSEIWRPRPLLAGDPTVVAPKPIPGGFRYFGPGSELFHGFSPGCGLEPSSITDFNGLVGVAHIQGNGTQTDTSTGKDTTLFFDADMRFMQGHYIGVDGKRHKSCFCFLWLDLFEGQGGPQVASINPGNVPGGVLWTLPIESTSVECDLSAAIASMNCDNIVTKDFGTLVNDLQHGSSVPVTTSFDVQWSTKLNQVQVQDTGQGFRGEFIEIVNATINFSAEESAFTFVSEAAGQNTVFAEIGREHNGVFFSQAF
jgi:hypothetical protein